MRSENCINVVRVVSALVFCLATVLLGPALVEGQGRVARGVLVSTASAHLSAQPNSAAYSPVTQSTRLPSLRMTSIWPPAHQAFTWSASRTDARALEKGHGSI
jgi:hypothetical protein